MMKTVNDKELISQYLSGDEKALAVLIGRHIASVHYFVLKRVNIAKEAEDITQEVFIKAWKNIKKFDKEKSFKAWIFSIAKNSVIDYLRKRKTLPFSNFENESGENALIESVRDESPLPDEFLVKKSMADSLIKLADKISEKYRKVILLYYGDGFNFREIAEILGESVNTVKSRHRRAILELRKLCAEA